jgi:hypothetical protein
MNEVLTIAFVFVIWIVVTKVIFPKLGIRG